MNRQPLIRLSRDGSSLQTPDAYMVIEMAKIQAQVVLTTQQQQQQPLVYTIGKFFETRQNESSIRISHRQVGENGIEILHEMVIEMVE